jgi:hypothetical protein
MSAGAIVGAIGRLAGGGNSQVIDETAGAISKLAGAGKQALGSITALASSITGGLLGPLNAVSGLFNTIGNLVGLFNPAIVTQFNLALNDTMAVLGSALVPVMQGLTIYTRAFGDALAGLLPVIQPIFNAIGQYIANFGQGFVPLIQAAAPFIQLFAEAISFMLEKLSLGVAFFQGIVAELLTMLADLFGLENKFKAANSEGFAQRQIRVSSVSQFADEAFAANARNIAGRGGEGQKPEAILADIRKAMQEGHDLVQKIEGHADNLYKLVKPAVEFLLRNTPGQTAIDIAKDPLGVAGKALGAVGVKKPW